MNSLEASRVLAVLDESLDALKSLTFVTSEVLDTAEQLKELLGEDMVNALVKHRSIIQSSKSPISNEAVIASTWELTRLIKKSSTAHRLASLHTDRGGGMQQALNFFERLRGYVQKRLTTTVEEDNSNREYFEEVREREEKAVAEKVQLEQKLKLQRVELQKQNNSVQGAEDKARAEIHDVQTSTATSKSTIEGETKSTRDGDEASYQGDLENLSKELSTAREQLAKLRDENREAEAALRKGKKRAQQDVESVIGEYDGDVGSKEAEYQKSLAEYNDVLKQLEEYSKGYAEMFAARQTYEEEERRKEQERVRKAVAVVRANRAARAIQAAWKAFKAKKIAEAKKKKKAEAKKKKK